ncbi:MAG: endonuclease III [Ruminococcaceae bacterium]|nr:endonuclease III [Oscillospiraceae bacterium]
MAKVTKKSDRVKLFSLFLKEQYPDALCALEYEEDPFKLIVMARLSAQCTDKRVNEVSKKLFVRFPDAKAFATAEQKDVEEIIRPCGLFRTKAESIISMSKQLIERHNGEVPSTYEDLTNLSGVGMKIANLMLGDVFHDPKIVPDTHCIRISHKTGLISKADPVTCEKELSRLIPKEDQSDFCHRIVLFGREYCKAPTPDCEKCPLDVMQSDSL